MTCKSCISRFFGILGSNIFFIALVAFAVAVSTNQWTVSHQRGVDVKGVLTDADMEFGIFDMLASVRQGEEVIWSQYSYNWCDSLDVRDPNAPWTGDTTYCNMLLTAQVCTIICLATGLTAGIIAAFLSAGVIVSKSFRDIACASSFFMLVQFASALITFACMFGINSKINRNLDHTFPGLAVTPSYSAALAVLSAGLVLLGFITTFILGRCGKERPTEADEDEEKDEEVGTTAPQSAENKKGGATDEPAWSREELKVSQ